MVGRTCTSGALTDTDELLNDLPLPEAELVAYPRTLRTYLVGPVTDSNMALFKIVVFVA